MVPKGESREIYRRIDQAGWHAVCPNGGLHEGADNKAPRLCHFSTRNASSELQAAEVYHFHFSDFTRLFSAWPQLLSFEADGIFCTLPAEFQNLPSHQVSGLQTFSLTNGSASVAEIRHLIGPSLLSLKTLVLVNVEGISGSALVRLVSNMLFLQSLV